MTWRAAPSALLPWLAALLLALLPFSIAAVEILALLLIVAWAFARAGGRQPSAWRDPSLRRTAIAGAAFFLLCAASILVSAHPVSSLRALIGKWLEYLFLMVVMVEVGARPRAFSALALVMAGASAAVAGEALWQEATGQGLLRHHLLNVYGRMSGPYTNPADLAAYLMVTIPIVAGVAVSSRRWLRVVLCVILVVLFGCFFRTMTTGAWVALAAASVLVLGRDRQGRRLVLSGLAVLALGGAIVLARGGSLAAAFGLWDAGTQDRVYMWQSALRMISDRPWLGHGLNTFMANYLAYWVGGEQAPRYAHNCYLQMAAETGVAGLAAFVALLGTACLTLWRALPGRLADRSVFCGFAIAVAAFVLQAAVDTNFYSLRQAALFWSLLGLALGAARARAFR